MDKSKKFSLMLDEVIKLHLTDFKDFDRTQNVQDQLQEMLPQFKGNSATIFNTLDELLVFMRENIYNFDTLEQFWLAFVLKNNYSKSWIDLEWK